MHKIPLAHLLDYIEFADFKGYDPYDALKSPFLKLLSFNSKYFRIAFIQALKRLPINLRRPLGVKKGYNPKALGLFLWGYSKLYAKEKKEDYLGTIEQLLSVLHEFKSKGYSGSCWGYNFDWQSKAFFIPKYIPTIVNSSFIGHALIDTYLYTGNQNALEMAIPIKDFILNDLNRKEENGTLCFSYTPIDYYFVHNANLLGASLLIRLYKETGNELLKHTALSALAYSMKHQREDGSWFYAEKESGHWIDSFHTGFNLQSIKYFLDEGYGAEYTEGFDKGVRFYADNFFLVDGTPKYYHNKIYPIDIHSSAQAVVFFSRLGDEYSQLTDRVLRWMVDNMMDKKGFFYFQKTRYYTNKIPYMRWSQAWAFHALTEYYLNKKNAPSE
jgi:hypothetical protein